jgi:hypothetical protein
MLLMSGALCGCQNTGTQTAGNPARPRDAFAAQVERQSYVDGNYQQQLKTGRAKNEKEARALAALEWETQERHRTDTAVWSARWSSDDAAKRRQQELEADLDDLDLK